MPGRIAAFAASLLGLGLVAYLILIGLLAAGQGRFMHPAPGGGHRPARAGWTEIALPSPDGTLAAYHLPARSGMPTVLFLHGNGTGYDASVTATAPLPARGLGVLVPEYPGYGGNPGSPSEGSLAAAADTARSWLDRRIPPSRVVVYGNSVGSGPAVHVARRPHAALVLVSPVASMVDVVRGHYPIAPGFLVRDRYDNEGALRSVKGPVLVVHARDDEVVPWSHGRRMAAAAPARFVDLPTGGHGVAFDPALGAAVADWITETTQ